MVGIISLALLGEIFSIQIIHGDEHGIVANNTTIVYRLEEGDRVRAEPAPLREPVGEGAFHGRRPHE